MEKPSYLQVGSANIAYHHHAGQGRGVMFLGGFKSDMQGSKALALEAYAKTQGWQFTRMDYGGHGQSSGTFEEGTIGLWLQHALAVLDQVTQGPQVLVGSSMGGWMMLLLALQRPQKVAALVGLASAPDFTEDLMWEAFTPEQRREMEQNGRVIIPNCMPGEADYPITRELIEEGRTHCLFNAASIPIRCPVHLLHGMEDADVPWERSLELMHKLDSDDVELTYVKNGDHRLSTADNLTLLLRTVERMRVKVDG